MGDLDDVAVASQINQVLSDRRGGSLQPQEEIKDVRYNLTNDVSELY